ncbi:helix-turn-helix transcriptional regulator [Brevundimonas sp. FT23042]|uniref:helix-turn-helix transcriptional regulator n=1 Tax=Brevundimonas sp. FT23042 TaxID=3393749 RepID=UPI003B58A5C3
MTPLHPIKTLRLEQDLTQAELAGRLGISLRTLRALENGRYDPSVTLACRVARHLQAPVETLFHR